MPPKKRKQQEDASEQGYSFIYPPNDRWKSSINSTSDYDVLDFLNTNLKPAILERLKQTIFSEFFKHDTRRVSKILIHNLLLREISQPNTNCIYINVAETVLYFGLEQFLLISGLKGPSTDGLKLNNTNSSKQLCAKLFPKDPTSFKKVDMDNLLKPNKNGKRKVIDDDDCFKFALVYFISFYIMGADPQTKLPLKYFDCVESGDYVDICWGEYSYQETLNGLKKNGSARKYPLSYRMEGCPIIFQK